MITILRDNEKVAVNYSVEDKLIPTDLEIKQILKKILYTSIEARATATQYSPPITLLNGMYARPNMFTEGHIKLYDENDNAIATADFNSAYSGTDKTRGSINMLESYNYIIMNKCINRIVVDFPTSVINGNVKKIKLFPYPNYVTLQSSNIPSVSHDYIYFTSPNPPRSMLNGDIYYCTDENQDMLIFEKGYGAYLSNRVIYKNKIYKFTPPSDLTHFFYTDKKFYYANIDKNLKIKLVELSIDELNGSINVTDNVINFDLLLDAGISIQGSVGDYSNIHGIHIYNGNFYMIGNFYQSGTKFFLAKYDENGTFVNIKYASYTNGSSMGFKELNCIQPYPVNGVIKKASFGTADFVVDFENETIVVNYNRSVDKFGDHCIYIKDIENCLVVYNKPGRIIEGNIFKSTKVGGVSFISTLIYSETSQKKDSVLDITFNEPIAKTDQQTLKIILDIEID